jgi:hypothetical protein
LLIVRAYAIKMELFYAEELQGLFLSMNFEQIKIAT